jgi:hypothetical protein
MAILDFIENIDELRILQYLPKKQYKIYLVNNT